MIRKAIKQVIEIADSHKLDKIEHSIPWNDETALRAQNSEQKMT